MDIKSHTSFIPKKAFNASNASLHSKGSSIGILFLLTLIIFISALALSLGVFLYQQFLIKDTESKSSQLKRARAEFEPTLIQEINRLDKRIQSSRNILGKHKAISSFFNLLEDLTLANIQFENLEYNVDENGRANISMEGKAKSFNSVALQSDIFGKSKFIQEPIFSNLNIDNKGDVEFDFTAFIDSSLILYENIILTKQIKQFEQ